MKAITRIQWTAAVLAAINTCMPTVHVSAAERPAAVRTTQTAAVRDVTLSAGQVLSGRVVNSQGDSIPQADVSIRQGNNSVGHVKTDHQGQSRFSNIKPGVYTLTTKGAEQTLRAWGEKTAPPSASEHAVLVMSDEVVRGQGGEFEFGTLGTVALFGGVAASAVLSGLAYSEVQNLPKSP